MADHDEEVARQQRIRRIFELRRLRYTFREIGEELGISAQRVHVIYRDALADIPRHEVDDARREQIEQLDQLERAALEVLAREHVVVSQGRIVRQIIGSTDDGKPVYGDPLVDDGPVLDAIRTLAGLQQRRARLLGLDAPTKVQAEVTEVTQADLELAELIREAEAKNAAEVAAMREEQP